MFCGGGMGCGSVGLGPIAEAQAERTSGKIKMPMTVRICLFISGELLQIPPGTVRILCQRIPALAMSFIDSPGRIA
jgi:hypothetical protein